MFQNKISLKALIPALFSLLLLLGTATVFHPCEMKEDGTWMHCHDAQTAIVIGGAILTVILIAAAFIQSKPAKVMMNGLSVICSIVIFLIPGTIISMCMMHTMRCYTVMQPFTRIMTAVIAIISLIQTVRIARN